MIDAVLVLMESKRIVRGALLMTMRLPCRHAVVHAAAARFSHVQHSVIVLIVMMWCGGLHERSARHDNRRVLGDKRDVEVLLGLPQRSEQKQPQGQRDQPRQIEAHGLNHGHVGLHHELTCHMHLERLVELLAVAGALGAAYQAQVDGQDERQAKAQYDHERDDGAAAIDERARLEREHDGDQPKQGGRGDDPARDHGEHGAQRLNDVSQYVTKHQVVDRVAVRRLQVVEGDGEERVSLRRQDVADGQSDQQDVERGDHGLALEHNDGEHVADAAEEGDRHEHDAPEHVAVRAVDDRLVFGQGLQVLHRRSLFGTLFFK